jgi:hypothetical protein
MAALVNGMEIITPAHSARHYGSIALYAILGAILAAALTYYLLVYRNNPAAIAAQHAKVESAVQDARLALYKGGGSETIPTLESSVSQATDVYQKAYAQLTLGSSYVASGMSDKGIALWKQISLDTNNPPAIRSSAAQLTLEHYLSSKDIGFALNNIFTGPTWGDFLQGSTSTDPAVIDLGVIRALEWTASLAPSFPTEYTLATEYGERIVQGYEPSKKAQYITLAQEHIKKGDAIYQLSVQYNQQTTPPGSPVLPPFSDYRLGVGIEHKAWALGDLYQAAAPDVTIAQVKKTYADSLAILEKDPTARGSIVSADYARFHLAAFLLHAEGQSGAQDIRDALAPIYNVSTRIDSDFYQGFLRQYGADPRYKGTLMWNDMVKLAKVDPRFKSLLEQLGWSDSVFS